MALYPYIGDKQMYAAVVYACKSIRKHHWFNVAVEHACAKYGVNREELEAHLKARQVAGQRIKGRVRKAQQELAAAANGKLAVA